MKVYNKMKWALGILLVFIIVLITNLYCLLTMCLLGAIYFMLFWHSKKPCIYYKK
jgi:hypothetical protein